MSKQVFMLLGFSGSLGVVKALVVWGVADFLKIFLWKNTVLVVNKKDCIQIFWFSYQG